MKQKSLIPKRKIEHGGAVSVGKRRGRRPLSTKKPIHLTLRSDYAKGSRSLLKHRNLVDRVIYRSKIRFNVRVYRYAICGNHLHFLIRGQRKKDLQNFFRVLSGHIAQQILLRYPLSSHEQENRGGAREKIKACKKNQRKFWSLLLYTRLVTWGREFQRVAKYIEQNILEALNLIAYAPRRPRFIRNTS
jgi:REP element-mobilizing transposase RayT